MTLLHRLDSDGASRAARSLPPELPLPRAAKRPALGGTSRPMARHGCGIPGILTGCSVSSALIGLGSSVSQQFGASRRLPLRRFRFRSFRCSETDQARRDTRPRGAAWEGSGAGTLHAAEQRVIDITDRALEQAWRLPFHVTTARRSPSAPHRRTRSDRNLQESESWRSDPVAAVCEGVRVVRRKVLFGRPASGGRRVVCSNVAIGRCA